MSLRNTKLGLIKIRMPNIFNSIITKIVLLVILSPLFVRAQISSAPNASQISKAYHLIIAEYIKDQVKKEVPKFDTLFIGKHENFSNIKLHKQIEGKHILLLEAEPIVNGPQNLSRFKLINIIPMHWDEKDAEFMLVTFHQGYKPQHNSYIQLKYDSNKKEYSLSREIRYDYAYSKKTTKD